MRGKSTKRGVQRRVAHAWSCEGRGGPNCGTEVRLRRAQSGCSALGGGRRGRNNYRETTKGRRKIFIFGATCGINPKIVLLTARI